MKQLSRILFVLALILPELAIAQAPPFVRNNTATTSINGPNLTPGSAAVTATGELFCSASGSATSLGKAEDSASASGDTGVMALGVRNTGAAQLAGTDLDYTPLAVNNQGAIFPDISYSYQFSPPVSLLKLEDSASASGDAMVAVGGIIESAVTANAGTTGDYSPVKMDMGGRTITTLAPAGETFATCSSAATNTSDTAIKEAVASNRYYVTTISCRNTSAVASEIIFKDASTQNWVGGIGASTTEGVGLYVTTFPTPLRGGSNTAFNFAMTTTATNTICCASGYISTI